MSDTGSGVEQVLSPTTRSQVSGHRFLQRRIEHGMVLGDIRMIHDPLARRRRGVTVGAVAVALLAAGALLFTFVSPQPDPRDASLVRTKNGALYVRVDEVFHPVSDVTSARLILGEPVEPELVKDSYFESVRRGGPVGLTGAPQLIAPHAPPDRPWAVCHHPGSAQPALYHSGQSPPPAPVERIDVIESAVLRPRPANEALLAQVDGQQWVVTHHGRIKVPSMETPLGRVLRTHLGIDPDTPVWRPPVAVFTIIPELPEWTVPVDLPTLHGPPGDEHPRWMSFAIEGPVYPLEVFQARILEDLGASTRPLSHADAAILLEPGGPRNTAEKIHLPPKPMTFIAPDEGVCLIAPVLVDHPHTGGSSSGSLRLLAHHPGAADGEITGGIALARFGADPNGAISDRAHGFFHRASETDATVHDDLSTARNKKKRRSSTEPKDGIAGGVTHAGAVAVDTHAPNGGLWVVNDHGVRHRLAAGVSPEVIGLPEPRLVPWSVIRLLPEGVALDPDQARTVRIPNSQDP